MTGHAEQSAPSVWVERWAPLIPPGRVLDLACGSGRHSRLLLARGHEVVAVDREPLALAGVCFVRADLEDGSPWPLPGERFQGIVVTNYLHRPLFPLLQQALVAGGILLYETFMVGNERYGKPSNPAFLLQPGELWRAFAGLHVIAFEQGRVREPKLAMIQRLCAARA
ncbi:MAG TPA: methyltransferase domain-containing protein [Burkholderiales bacterium]|jgi:SAM-dependent methyltransferase|nr:methyltransferase domain-containing protein [Burkholderiales bacterium]